MNYSRQEVKKKQKNMISNAVKMKFRIRNLAAFGGLVIVLTLLLLCAFGMAGAVRGVMDGALSIDEVDLLSEGTASILYDTAGDVMQVLSADDMAQEYVTIDEIPVCVQQAFVASEDKWFYEHHGIDMTGLLQAFYTSITGDEGSGADNTITLKLIQNQVIDGASGDTFLERFARGIQEQKLAVELEDRAEKSQILEYYLNTINIGENVMGVGAAARRYFDKDISEVNVSEAAVLAATASNPSQYNPVTDSESNAEKRQTVLKAMLDEGYISEAEYEEALGDDVYMRIQNANSTQADSNSRTDSYYADAVVEQVITDLKEELGYSQTEAYNALYRGGLKVYTCQNTDMQEICDEVINTDSYYPETVRSYLSYTLVIEKDGVSQKYSEVDLKNYFLDAEGKNVSLYFKKTKKAKRYIEEFRSAMLKEGGETVQENIQLIKQPQTSFVLIEQSTGRVQALVGGRGDKTANNTVNRATEYATQPGSALSVLSAYASALDTAGATLGDVEDDTKYYYTDTSARVYQWNDTSYRGLITMREAITGSRAVSAVKTLEKISVQTGYGLLKKLGFSTIVENAEGEDGTIETDLELKLAVGEMTEGVTNLELTAAYAAIANGGVYNEARFYTKVFDQDGNVLLDKEQESTRVLKETTAWLLTDVLQETVSSGTAKSAKFDTVSVAQAGCVGYVKDNTDYWFEGYTPYYTAGIWSGQDEAAAGEVSDYQVLLWKEIMQRIHQAVRKTKGSFTKPSQIVTCFVCSKCGKLAVDGLCDEAEGGSTVRTEYYVDGTQPTQNCTCHVKYAFCKESGELAGENCPEEDIIYKVLLEKDEETETADMENTVAGNVIREICSLHN